MKTITCKQLGGACDREFHANTFEEMAEQSKKHGIEMANQGEPTHLKSYRLNAEADKITEGIQFYFEN